MKQADVETINAVYYCLKSDVPIDDELIKKFGDAVNNFNEIINKQKQKYNDNADYYRQRTKQWRIDNKEKNAEYQKEYMKRDYVKERMAKKKREKRKEAER